MDYNPDAATSTVFATLSFVCMVGSVLVLAFEYLRPNHADIYLPRVRYQGHRMVTLPPPGPFRWIQHVLKISDDDFFWSVGLDGFVLLRYLRLCCKMALSCGAVGLIILAPVYFSCPGNDGVAGINLYTMANVEQNGSKLWAPFVLTWAFTLWLLYLLHEEYGAFAHHRQGFLEHGDPDMLKPQTRYSVLVENIPVEYRSTEKLAEFFENLFPGEVAHACISVGMGPLAEAVEKRDAAVANAEIAVAAGEASEAKERPLLRLYKGIPVHSVCTCGSVTEVDALEYYQTEITELDEKVVKYQEEARVAECGAVLPPDTRVSEFEPAADIDKESTAGSGASDESIRRIRSEKAKISKEAVSGTGFVTFKSRRAQAAACQMPILSQKYPQLKVYPAPAQTDIVWPNITTTLQYTKETSGLTKVVYYMGIGFWGLVLAFIATISNLEILDDYIPFISDIDPVLYAVIAGVLPVLMLSLFMAYLPTFMEWISHYIEKRKTRSAITMEVFNWNFLYQITNVYLLMLAGSVANAISDLIDDPSSILVTLGAALPAISVFFINYSLNVLLVEIPADMLRAVPLAIIQFYRYVFNEKALTPRQIVEGPLAKEPLDYGRELPNILYFVALAITYWAIAPILVGVLAFVFLFYAISWKYKMLYVNVPEYESGGMYWYGLYKYTMYALVASTLTMIGYMGLKEGAAQSSGLLPLLYVIYRAWDYTEECYKDISLHFAYSTAVEEDFSNIPTANERVPILESFNADYFKQPYYSAPQVAKLQAYRIDNTPLWTQKGTFSSVYYTDTPQYVVENSGVDGISAAGYGSFSDDSAVSVGHMTPDEELTAPLTGGIISSTA